MSLLPTFSPAGWVGNPLEVVDYMLAYFFETQKSQSHFHKGVVKSYQTILADNNSPAQIASELETVLIDYFKTQFTNVQLSVQVDDAFGIPDNSEQTVTIGCTFDSQGKRYSLSHAVELLGTNVKRIYRLDETGQLT
jgi:hypothetical protein